MCAAECVSRQEMESTVLAHVSGLQQQLDNWQNVTLNIIKDYLFNDRGTYTKYFLGSILSLTAQKRYFLAKCKCFFVFQKWARLFMFSKKFSQILVTVLPTLNSSGRKWTKFKQLWKVHMIITRMHLECSTMYTDINYTIVTLYIQLSRCQLTAV